ncbi:MAG: hypothetical protein HYZ16_10425 [Bacteroidetes bacterium]|jgi:hypothetical protein|nr:hypothetical protein [Bacteroidota bacterium]
MLSLPPKKRTVAIVAAIILVLVAILMGRGMLGSPEPDPLPLGARQQMEQLGQDLDKIVDQWDRNIDSLTGLSSAMDQESEGHRLTELLAETFQYFGDQAADLKADMSQVRDSLGLMYCIKELEDLRDLRNAGRNLLNEHRKILGSIVTVAGYKQRIDSLKELINKERNNKTLPSSELIRLNTEISEYEKKLKALQQVQGRFNFFSDSLQKVSGRQAAALDSLTAALKLQGDAYTQLLEAARKNAALANKLNLWYFEKDNLSKPRRRQLTGSEKDHNIAGDIRTINGVFTLSAEIYKPFEVATVYLYYVLANEKPQELAQVKVSVRDQESGEFSLLPSRPLTKGKHEVIVEYTGNKVLSQLFYVQ